MHFHLKYFAATVLLFITEVVIALYINDDFIRPYFGDVLVVMLIYCFIKSFFITDVIKTAIGVLLFSYLIEMLQYYRYIEVLGLQESKLARVVLGTSFSWNDIMAYTIGVVLLTAVEMVRASGKKPYRKHAKYN